MSDTAPLGTRLLRDTSDWDAVTEAEVIAARERNNRLARSRVLRIVGGMPDRAVRITDTVVDLPGRRLPVRVYRPKRAAAVRLGPEVPLPLILSLHGGGFVSGTAAQNDWLNSHLAARCAAVVVGVDYRLAPEHPLPAPIEDGYDTLVHLLDEATEWGVDPSAVAVVGESAGGLIAALIAARARADGRSLLAQVLNYPVTDWTDAYADYPSIRANADNPTLSLPRLRAARRLSLPPTLDARVVSPLAADDLAGLPPTLVVTAALDPVADHGARYVDRLRAAGVDARLRHSARATHGFLSTPGLVPAAKPARREIAAFLTGALRGCPSGDEIAAGRRTR